MTTWIHRMVKVGKINENGAEEVVYIPDEEFMENWQAGDPAGYKDRQKYKDWSVLKVSIPEELDPDEGDETERIQLNVNGKKIFLADVLANGKYGSPVLKIGDKEYKLEPVRI